MALVEGLITTQTEKASVTQGDIPKSVYYVSYAFPLFGNSPYLLPNLLPASLPRYWSLAGDIILYESPLFEPAWSGALRRARSKVVAKAWELSSDKPTILNRYQTLLKTFDYNKSWVHFFSKIVRDYLCTDNGAFIEVERESNAAGSRIKRLHHLDSRRCRRTGIPETPVIYTDYQGNMHVLKDYQVLDLVDMPETGVMAFGTGQCAARGAYQSIRLLNALNQFYIERIAGSKPLAIDFISGMTDEQIKNALNMQDADRRANGGVVYGGTVLIPSLKGEVSNVRVPMADIPQGFDRKEERRIAIIDYANNIGMDPQELDPGTLPSGLGAGAQSQVLDEKETGSGLSALIQEMTHILNQYVLPDSVTFAFSENDLRDRLTKANIFNMWATGAGTVVDKGVTSASQALQKLVDENQLPKEFLPQDLTPYDTLSDTEKPMEAPSPEEMMQAVEQQAQARAQAQAAQAQQAQPQGKGGQ